MAGLVGEQVAQYFELHEGQLLDSWMAHVKQDPHDPYQEEMRNNGTLMLNIVMASSRGTFYDNGQLRELAYKVSEERLKSNVNISEFVYNVTVGRSELFSHIPQIPIPIDELYPVFRKFDDLFDEFLYLAVHHYTELKNLQLREQEFFIEQSHKDKLTILGQMSSSFVHEFRNPLTSVIGFVQLLQQKYPSLEYIDILTKELNDLKFRITQFLLVSKKGGDQKHKEVFAVRGTVDDTLDFLYPMIVESCVTIERDVDASIELRGYPDEFRQVLINIIMNSLDALSSVPNKRIRIHAAKESAHAVLTVTNNGPPIPPGMMTTIFEPFVSSKKFGTGIGLYLCRRIVEDHEGSIECTSDASETVFSIRIPLYPDG